MSVDPHDTDSNEEFSDIEPDTLDSKDKKNDTPKYTCPLSENLRGIDVSYGKKGAIYKKILKEGTGTKRPISGVDVTVHYVGTLLSDGSKFDSSRDRNEPFKFPIGKKNVIRGWDEGVESMVIGEVSILTICPDYAYGASGSPPKIPPNSWLQFEVELLDFEEPVWNMSNETRLEKANEKKEKGNELFKMGNYNAAIRTYESAKPFLDAIPETETSRVAPQTTIYLNIAMSHLKLKQSPQAIVACNKALEFTPDSTKALYRRGLAHLEAGEYREGEQSFADALDKLKAKSALLEGAEKEEVEKEIKIVTSENARLKKKEKDEIMKERATYGGWFNKIK